jgi:hypothetical protein
MKRPEEHQTDDRGDAIFREVFSEWTVNPSEKDYGWDYVVEVFRDNESLGLLFNAQLKSSIVTSYSADATFISQPLEMDAAKYLSKTLKQPTFLFHADVNRKQLFWSAIQLDRAVLRSLDKGDTHSLIVRIPTSNLPHNSFDRFLDALVTTHLVVVSRALVIADDTDFVDAMRSQPVERIDAAAEDLHEKAFRLTMQAAYEIFRKGAIQEAKRRLNGILASADASLRVRFNVTVQMGN